MTGMGTCLTIGPWATSLTRDTVQINKYFVHKYTYHNDYTITLIERRKLTPFGILYGPYLQILNPLYQRSFMSSLVKIGLLVLEKKTLNIL